MKKHKKQKQKQKQKRSGFQELGDLIARGSWAWDRLLTAFEKQTAHNREMSNISARMAATLQEAELKLKLEEVEAAKIGNARRRLELEAELRKETSELKKEVQEIDDSSNGESITSARRRG